MAWQRLSKRLLVVLLDGVDDAVLDMVLQNDLADVVDGRAHGGDLDQDLRAVASVLHHLLDRLQMADGAGKPVEHRLRVRVNMAVRARLMRMVVVMRDACGSCKCSCSCACSGGVDVLRRMQVGNVVFVQIFVVVFHDERHLPSKLV